jgi:CheY-like chemotaxis protein
MKKIIIAESILNSVGKADSLFGRGGITILTARTAEDILVLHRKRRADLIIADLALPVMGGAQLCSAIRQDEALKGVSIIMACDSAELSLPACRDAGANAVIAKPVDPVGLFTKITELLVVPQRKDMRVLMRVSVNGGNNGASFFATSENISLSGMLLESNYRFKENDRLACSFFIGHSEVLIEGVVMRVERTTAGRSRYGIRFLNPPTKALIVIEQFVQRQGKAEGNVK